MVKEWSEIDQNAIVIEHLVDYLNVLNDGRGSVEEKTTHDGIPLPHLSGIAVYSYEIASSHGKVWRWYVLVLIVVEQI